MELGMIGLGRMGGNMVRRLMTRGVRCVVYNRTPEPVAALAAEGAIGTSTLQQLASHLAPPRHVWLMVPAAVVDRAIDDVAACLQPGDVIIDGGNSNFQDDIARAERLKARGLHYLDAGV